MAHPTPSLTPHFVGTSPALEEEFAQMSPFLREILQDPDVVGILMETNTKDDEAGKTPIFSALGHARLVRRTPTGTVELLHATSLPIPQAAALAHALALFPALPRALGSLLHRADFLPVSDMVTAEILLTLDGMAFWEEDGYGHVLDWEQALHQGFAPDLEPEDVADQMADAARDAALLMNFFLPAAHSAHGGLARAQALQRLVQARLLVAGAERMDSLRSIDWDTLGALGQRTTA